MMAVMEKRRTLTLGLQNQSNLSIDDIRKNYNHERAWWNTIKPEMSGVEALSVPGPLRDIALRIYRPFNQNPSPTLLYLHGGGWVWPLYTSDAADDPLRVDLGGGRWNPKTALDE